MWIIIRGVLHLLIWPHFLASSSRNVDGHDKSQTCVGFEVFLGRVLATTKTHPSVRTLSTAVSTHSITTNLVQDEFKNYRQMYGEMPEEALNRSVAYRGI
jgi:hypothetical protein